MHIPFSSLPGSSRIWIYQSPRALDSHETKIISDALHTFTQRWSVHGVPMPASFDIRFDQFIILAADEDSVSASGCSIDDSVRTLKEIGGMISVDLFDRTKVCFKSEGVFTMPVTDLKKEYLSGKWSGGSLLFNNLISTKGDLETKWLVPAETTWISRYIPKETVVDK